jgi:hypothetical protein
MNDSTVTWCPTPAKDAILDVLPAGPPGPPLVDVLPAGPEPILDVLPARGFLGTIWHFIGSAAEWVFGVFALIVGLAVLSAIPIVQFLSLGYLLEVAGRVARTGRLRDGLVGVRRAARVGSIGIGCGLMYLVLYLPASLSLSAEIIDPGGPVAQKWRFWTTVLSGAVMVHVVAALSRGGKLRYFFWPFNFIWLIRRLWRGGYYRAARDATWDFVISLRLPYYFWLGLRGAVGVLAWLAVPIFLMSLGTRFPPIGFAGSFLLMFVLLYVPFLQTRFARDNRFRALFEWRTARQEFRRAPVAYAFALLITLALSLPLYLAKIQVIPPELIWLESLFFVVLIYPARLLTGWAVGRAGRRTTPRHWVFRWLSRLSMLPVVAFYVFLLFFTQYIAWGGVSSLYEQHAFMPPAPFMQWSVLGWK